MKNFLVLIFAFVLTVTQSWAQAVLPHKVYTNDGVNVRSYDFTGLKPIFEMHNDTTYVINFWATWCQPCIKELPSFEKVGALYENKKVKVILVSLDMAKQVETKLIPFIKKKNLRSTVLHLHDPDANSWIAQVDPSWSGAIPATVIYRGGKSKFYEQEFTFDSLEKEIISFQ